MEIGQVCVKVAGRDAGRECVVVDVVNDNIVLVEGNTRRRKCNIKHLELLESVLNIGKNAGHDEVLKAMKEAGINVSEAKKGSKQRAKGIKPVKKRKALLKQNSSSGAGESADDVEKKDKKQKEADRREGSKEREGQRKRRVGGINEEGKRNE